MFLTGPQVVEQAMGEEVGDGRARRPPGPRAKRRVRLRRPRRRRRDQLVRELLGYLPQSAAAPPAVARRHRWGPIRRRRFRRRAALGYDVREVIARLVDGGRCSRLAALGAQHGHRLARIEGHAGRRDRQPGKAPGRHDRHRGPEKAARFVGACDAFGVPLVVLVDTPGFMPGTARRGRRDPPRGRAGASVRRRARAPKATVILRKAYGGGFITMNSKDLGAHVVSAGPERRSACWAPVARSGSSTGARSRAPPIPSAERERFADEYADGHLSADVAAAPGTSTR